MFSKREKITAIAICTIHCSYTPKLFIVLGVITALTQYAGDPIRCTVDGVPFPEINTDCGIVGATVTTKNPNGQPPTPVTLPAYYRWTCWFLFFQAFLCYLPKWMWKRWEKELVNNIPTDLKNDLRSEEDIEKYTESIRKYLTAPFEHVNAYAVIHWLCRALCLANAVFQILMIHWFLNGHFTYQSSEGFKFRDDEEIHSLAFPHVVNCTFSRVESSGIKARYDAVCSLPWNGLNEKIYIFLRIWFVIMAILIFVVSIVMNLIAWIMLLTSRGRAAFFRTLFPNISLHLIECFSGRVSFGDIWLFSHIGQNINPSILSDIIEDVAFELYREV